jgi:hypothetical protein
MKVPDSLPSNVDLHTRTIVLPEVLVTEYTLLIHDITPEDLYI